MPHPLTKTLNLSLIFQRRWGSVWLWCLVAAWWPALRVEAQFQFDVWTTDNGLPQNSVNAILQTRDGYLWLTTFDGLVRYDGVRFTVFNPANTQGIRSSRFTRLYEDRAGNLWALTENGGLTCYRGGVFRTYTTKDGLPHNYVRAVLEEPDGSLVLETDGGFARWKDEQFLPYRRELDEPFSRLDHSVASGTVWHLDQDRWYRWWQGRVSREVPAQKLAEIDIKTVSEDRQGTFWVGTADASLRGFKDGQWQVYRINSPTPQGSVQAILEDREGNLWVGTSGGGLFRFREGQFTPYPLSAVSGGNGVSTIYEDREGVLWVGTTQGLFRRRNQVVTTYTEADGLAANNVYPIFEDHQGAIWIGSWSGLTRYEHGVFTRHDAPDGSPYGQVTALYEDRDGNFWVAIYGAKVWRYRQGQVEVFTAQDGTLFKTGIHVIYQDRAGNLWFGSRNGLTRYRDGTAARYTTEDGLTGNDVRVIYEDHQGTLWFGTTSGLTRYREGRFTPQPEPDGQSHAQIRSIYEDGDGVLWVGTYDLGLTRWAGGRFTRYTTHDGLFSNGVFSLLEDQRGYFWISCNTGIFRVSRRELNDFAEGKIKAINSITFGKRDGMRKAECNGGSQPSGIRARDGRLWFPTQEGVAVIDPEHLSPNTQPPPVLIEEVLLDGQAVAARQPVRVGPGEGNLEIHYTGLSFALPEGVKFKFKLAGLDADWVDARARRVAYYSHIPPGGYTFTVTAANQDGVWNPQGASVRILVVPPFWRTWWFLGLTGLGFASLLLLAYRRRIAQLERARVAQESFARQLIASQEGERQRIAAELHDSLGQRLVVIKNLALLVLHQPADPAPTRQQVEEISAETSQAIHEVKEISYNLRPHQLDQLGLTKALGSIVKRVGASSGIAFSSEVEKIDGLFPKESEISLYRIVQEAVNNIVKHSGATAAVVAVTREAEGVRLTIRDNGRGFVPGAGSAESRAPSFGLFGISERVRMLGGRHVIHSAPGEGTTITIEIGLRNGHHGD